MAKMPSMNFMELCRLCLVKEEVSVPIFEGEGDNRQIFVKIAACLPVKVERDDKLPKKICDSCLHKVENVYQFWNTTANSEKQLLRWLEETKTDDYSKRDSTIETEQLMVKEESVEEEGQDVKGGDDQVDLEGSDGVNSISDDESNSDDSPTVSDMGEDVQEVADKEDGDSEDLEDEDDEELEPTTFVNVSMGCEDQPGPSGAQVRMEDDPVAVDTPRPVGQPRIAPAPGPKLLPKPAQPAQLVAATAIQPAPTATAAASTSKAVALPSGSASGAYVLVLHNMRDMKTNNKICYFTIPRSKDSNSVTLSLLPQKKFQNSPKSLETPSITVPGQQMLQGKNSMNESSKPQTILPDSPLIPKVAPLGQQLLQLKNSNHESLKPQIMLPNSPLIPNGQQLVQAKNSSKENLKPRKRLPNSPVTPVMPVTPGQLAPANNSIKGSSKPATRTPTEPVPVCMESAACSETECDGEAMPEEPSDEETISAVDSKESPEETIQCDICLKEFKTALQKNGHMQVHRIDANFEVTFSEETGKTIIKCRICDKEFSSALQRKRHMRAHRELSYECSTCKKVFTYPYMLKIHMKIHTASEEHKCDICDFITTNKTYLRIHKKKNHTLDLPYKCETCGKCFPIKSYWVNHTKTHTGENKATCNVCNKTFTSKHYMTAHRRNIHEMIRPFKCDVCDKSYFRATLLRTHQKRAHTKQTPGHLCDICGKALTTRTSLRDHRMLHTGEKPQKCHVCGKAFSKKELLRLHIRIHTGEKPYSCDTCHRSFSQRSTLVVHKRYHTGERPYKCTVCGKGFITKTVLKSHQRSH